MLKPILCVLAVMVAATMGFAAHAREVAGYWTGVLNGRIHLVVHLAKTSGGTYQGSIENTDNESGPVPLSAVVAEAGNLHLVADQVGGHYEGKWDARQRAWIGKWTMQGQTLPLVLVHADAPPPSPKNTPRPQDEAIARGPLPYSQRDIRFENRAAHVTLAGALTIPPGKGPFPAVVLISGTGANTRDEVSAGHRIFLVLADALTRKGILVLRYDKRGVGSSTGDYGTATTTDFASDAKAAVDWLAGQRNVDPRHIGVIGHSEGGVIAPMVAVVDKRVAFVVMLAGPGVRGDKLFVEQAAEVALASGAPRSYVEKRRAFDRSLYAAVVDAPDHAAAARNVKAIVARGLAQKIVEPKEAETLPDDVTRPWMTQFLKLDPAVALRKLDVPALALNGSLDLAVPAALNLPAIRNALKHDPDATVVELPGLNHLFQDAKTGAPSEFARIPETMAPSALALIADWVRKHSGPACNAIHRANVAPSHPTVAAARVCARSAAMGRSRWVA
ncbi:MAG: alpha/beta fold hydrolase [Xanthomonadaceae bacterium]|nr:alpha/beta fold hydrolase [Xanthomonadaceae bacterium]